MWEQVSTELELSSAEEELSMSWLPLPLWLLSPSASEAEEISSDGGSVALLSSQAVSDMAIAAAANPQAILSNLYFVKFCFIKFLLFLPNPNIRYYLTHSWST
jgi:hypothetical protein